jgi:AraC family transcriptional regulator
MKHPIKTSSSNGDRRLSRGNGGGDPRLERAIRFFAQRFAERVTIQEAAQAAGLSSDYFVEVFRAALGCTPHQYLVRCRLRHARQLIASEGHRRSLADIAWAAGFADQAHLTRHFQRAFGQSPGQWRQQILCKTGFHFPGFVQDAWLTVRSD